MLGWQIVPQRTVSSRRRYLHDSICTAVPMDDLEISSPRRYQGAGLISGRPYASLRTQHPAHFLICNDTEMGYSPYRLLEVSVAGEREEPAADCVLCDCSKQGFYDVSRSTELQWRPTSPLRAQLAAHFSYTNEGAASLHRQPNVPTNLPATQTATSSA